MFDVESFGRIILNQHSENNSGISKEKKKWLDSMDTYTLKFLQQELSYLHSSVASQSIDLISKGEGIYLENLLGRKIIDFNGGISSLLGYNNPVISDRIKEQLENLTFCSSKFTNNPIVEMAHKICELSPRNLKKVLFTSNESISVCLSLKMAMYLTGKNKIISLGNALNGSGMTISGEGNLFGIFESFDIQQMPYPEYYRNIFNTDKANGYLIKYADFVENLLEDNSDICAIIAEPINTSAVNIPSELYWKKIGEICNKFGALLIMNEISTGLGRTGKMFAFEHYDIIPDIVILGKGLGGGIIPISALIISDKLNFHAKADIYDYVSDKNPLGAAAALSLLKYIEDENLLEYVVHMEGYIRGRLLNMRVNYPIIGDVRGLGFLWAIELVKNPVTKEKAKIEAERLMYRCLKKGLNIHISSGNIIVLTPPLIVSQNELDVAFNILEDCIAEISR